jgi:hypothetical protein
MFGWAMAMPFDVPKTNIQPVDSTIQKFLVATFRNLSKLSINVESPGKNLIMHG